MDLSEYDFMELVVFQSTVDIEGFSYAAQEYAPAFEKDNLSTTHDRNELDKLLAAYEQPLNEFWQRPDADDLHDQHLDRARQRRDDALLWGVRQAQDESVVPVDTESHARRLVGTVTAYDRVMHRDIPGGEWRDA